MNLRNLVALGLLALVGAGLVVRDTWRAAHPPAPSADQKAFVEVTAERALFDNMNIRVVISARMRPTATVAKIDFVHVSGYFLDQDGTKYSPGFTAVNNRGLPTADKITATTIHDLRPGETYRYCLGPARLEVDNTSEASAASTIKRVTVYLDGAMPKEVPVSRWRCLDFTYDDILKSCRDYWK